MNIILGPIELAYFLQQDRRNPHFNKRFIEIIHNNDEINLNWLYKAFANSNNKTNLRIEGNILSIYHNGFNEYSKTSFNIKYILAYVKLKIGFQLREEIRITRGKYIVIR